MNVFMFSIIIEFTCQCHIAENLSIYKYRLDSLSIFFIVSNDIPTVRSKINKNKWMKTCSRSRGCRLQLIFKKAHCVNWYINNTHRRQDKHLYVLLLNDIVKQIDFPYRFKLIYCQQDLLHIEWSCFVATMDT